MAETIGGVVKNGVIVPDAPFPEGVRVSITLQPPLTFTPEEREEFEAWNHASDKALELVERLASFAPLDKQSLVSLKPLN
jgi:hypothetical protein